MEWGSKVKKYAHKLENKEVWKQMKDGAWSLLENKSSIICCHYSNCIRFNTG